MVQVPHHTGELIFERQQGRTVATHEYVAYPLKFLHPTAMITPGMPTAVTCILGYGGGLVGGDSTHMHVQVRAHASVVLCTQATTKVYKAKPRHPTLSTQELTVSIGPDAILALVPDPVTCFDGAMYKQHQRFSLAPSANLVFIDWMTSGRHARGESWSFASYDSCNDVTMIDDAAPVLLDRVRLQHEIDHDLAGRMGGMRVLGTIVLLGPRVAAMAQALLVQGARKTLQPNAAPVPSGHLPSSTAAPINVRVAVSPLGSDGAIVRLAAPTTEDAYAYAKTVLAPLETLVGFKCFEENR
ncbi:Aste57867_14987 [Aphanomyces stellatus]|uniref:Aste57867_14987 protein n=1 Tax=Aphanomyces stellatus TaxID=120398 RepID=A0A485L4R6_9STRA|nr:hypothetical protein As57867_014931 [Aphanomyces stellatus]VFT91801.1 Aste57867_14987 [Aphanomyces stellatus]